MVVVVEEEEEEEEVGEPGGGARGTTRIMSRRARMFSGRPDMDMGGAMDCLCSFRVGSLRFGLGVDTVGEDWAAETDPVMAVTGADGKYSFTFDRTRTEKYTLYVKKNLYFEQEEEVYYSQLKLKETNIRNVSTTAKSWVEIKIFNNNAANNDHLQFIRQQGKIGCSECCFSGTNHLYGFQDTSIFCINDGNSLYSIEYAVFGTSNTGIIGVNTTPFDTTVLNLTY
jgi:hypothetical protein